MKRSLPAPKIGLIAIALGHDCGTAISKQALNEFPSSDAIGIVIGELIVGNAEYITAECEGPGSEAGSINAQLITNGAFSSCTGIGICSCSASHFP